MSRYALHAVIAIRIAAQQGKWVETIDLCTYLGVPYAVVLRACQEMERSKLLVSRRIQDTDEICAVRTPCDELHPEDPSRPAPYHVADVNKMVGTADVCPPRDLSDMYSMVAIEGGIL